MPARKMPALMRHDLIVKKLEVKGFATTIDFANWLCVSEMTARRDFDHLAKKGLLTRTHGGVVSLKLGTSQIVDLIEPNVSEREQLSKRAKSAIAACACDMIAPDQTIALDIGTTTFALAQLLTDSRVTIFTSSLKIASALKETQPKVYVPAGRISGSEPSVIGPQAVDFFRKYYFDIAFVGASGITAEGLFDYSPNDAEVKRAFVERSRTTVALLDSTKFDRISVANICALQSIDVIITDTKPPAQLCRAIGAAGIRIEVADSETLKGNRHDF